MNKKLTMIPLLLAIFVQSLSYSFACPSVSRLAWGFYWEGIRVKIYAPYQADPGDLITIRVTVEAFENLTDVSISLHLYGALSEGYDTWYNFTNLLNIQNMTYGTIHDQSFDVYTPSDLSPGLTYGKVTCVWKVYRFPSWDNRSREDSFTVTYFVNKLYEELLANYTAILTELDYWKEQANYWENQSNYWENQFQSGQHQSDYWSIRYSDLYSNYTSLESNYNSLQTELNVSRILIYVFIATTLIFIAATVYFAVRKQNKKDDLWYRRI